MSNPNKMLWERVYTTDPKAVKPITGKQYKGNSPKPYWIVERLTDEFGPCGKGWGFTIISERMERLSETDILHIAVIDFWYRLENSECHIQQIGQTKASYLSSASKLIVDEDAPKKSVTDALVKCASYIGFAGDIFDGRWDDSKYVAEANREWRARDKANEKYSGPGVIKSTDGAGDHLSDDRRSIMEEMSAYLVEAFESGDEMSAVTAFYQESNYEEQEEKVYLWKLLGGHSKLRAFIKANKPAPQGA